MLQRAFALHQKGQLAEAKALYLKILAHNPDHADALHLLGTIELAQNNLSAAIERIDRAIALKPGDPTFLSNHAYALHLVKRFEEAVESCDRALALKPDYAEALTNRGNALQGLERFEEALLSHERALKIKPNAVEALIGRGAALRKLKRLDDALSTYDRALALKPNDTEALFNKGNVLYDLRRFDAALVAFARVLAVTPDDVDALLCRANLLRELKRFDAAFISYTRALAIDQDRDFLFGAWLHCKMMLCDWQELAAEFDRFAAKVENQGAVATPFHLLATPLSSAQQRTASEVYIRKKYPARTPIGRVGRSYDHDRIRLAYVSEDFRDHAVAVLSAGLFEAHDRNRFEVIALSFGPAVTSAMRTRLEDSFDRFIDVSARSDEEITQLALSLEVDIAIDLNGLTGRDRTGVFALRAAPIQVNYLGYPGTMGAEYIDYLIADTTVAPEDQQQHYSEKLVYLPDTYVASDSRRRIANTHFTRVEAGLPEKGFVFCCFNNTYKLNPQMFDIWMRLLKSVDGSVLWLSQNNDPARANLRQHAKSRGIAPDRLVFAPFLKEPSEHLARLKLADLFLDTLPYNAHATASDALWAGVPVLTCLGTTLPGRVAASLLKAIGLPELITHTLEDYESLARKLAMAPEKLSMLKQSLTANRATHPLFDTARFTRNIEGAYIAMWERHRAGLAPDHIYIRGDSEALLSSANRAGAR